MVKKMTGCSRTGKVVVTKLCWHRTKSIEVPELLS